MKQIICNNLTLGYGDNIVISDLSFSINKGDYICIVGENGSGKSTLTKALVGIMPTISGSIIKTDDFKDLKIGYLPQQTQIQNDFPATVKEVVSSGISAKNQFFINRAERNRIYDTMKKLGIANISKKSIRDLSGGQKQRVFLARAMCVSSSVLLLDEPVSGLDPLITEELYLLLKKLNKEDKTTIIMVSHDIASAITYATHILHIGKDSSFYGTVNEYLESDIGKSFVQRGELDD